MAKSGYSEEFKIKVAAEAALPENRDCEHLVAKKYQLLTSTVERWKKLYVEHGPSGLRRRFRAPVESLETKEYKKRIQELEEEVQILKKAAAFLANIDRE